MPFASLGGGLGPVGSLKWVYHLCACESCQHGHSESLSRAEKKEKNKRLGYLGLLFLFFWSRNIDVLFLDRLSSPVVGWSGSE